MVYFGCVGSCDSSFLNDAYNQLFRSRVNGDVYKDGKKMYFVYEPGFPLGLYGYMLSKKGVKKLVDGLESERIKYGIDYYIAKEILDNKDFKVYAFSPPLVENKLRQKKITNHEILAPFTDKMKISNSNSVNSMWNSDMYHVRIFGTDVSYFSTILLFISFIIGYYTNESTQRIFLAIVTLLQLFEMGLTRTDKNKLKNLIFELLLIYVFYYIGFYIKNRLGKV